MKKILFIALAILFSIGLSAQKDVRKALRSGNKAYNDQLYGTAEAEYSKAIEKNASSKEAAYNLANTYYKQQKWDDAVKEYQHYLTLENEDPNKMSAAWSNMGNTFLKKKANEKNEMQAMMQAQGGQQGGQQNDAPKEDALKLSMEAYKNALRLNPTDDDTRYNLAVVQKMLKDRENKDQDQDQKKDQKQDQKQDQNEDQKQDPKQDDQKQDQKQDQQQQNQMSQQNMEQILQAIEQDEKETQDKVNKAKAEERKRKNENNRKQNKDW